MLDRILLFPYTISLAIRNAFYNKGGKRVRKAEVPTICVGNVTVGGTGKTPHVEMILRMLMQTEKWGAANLAVLSRGYKRRSKGFRIVTPESGTALAGDEPLQIKKKFLHVTVAVDKNRIHGCSMLCHPDQLNLRGKGRRLRYPECPPSDLIILDDAYQYRKLKADLNIVLVDYNRPVQKDKLLPLGSLRDLPSRVYDADIIIVTKCPYSLEDEEKKLFLEDMGIKEFDPVGCQGVNPSKKYQHVFFTQVRYLKPVPMYSTSDPRYIYSKNLILFTGIAADKALKYYLSDSYHFVSHRAFPDHHRFSQKDFRAILRDVRKHPTSAVLTTEKDAQRVLDIDEMPETLRERMFYIPIETFFTSPREEEVFKERLEKTF